MMAIKVICNKNWFKRHLVNVRLHPHNFINARLIHQHLHFIERTSERLKRQVTVADITGWLSCIARGESHVVDKQTGHREVHLLFIDGKTLPVVYSTLNKVLVTILPPSSLRTNNWSTQ